MGITNSIGAYQAPGLFNNKNLTPIYADFLQTSGTLAGTTTINVIAKEAASDTCHLLWLNVTQTDPTAAAVTSIYAATATVIGQFATGGIGTLAYNFGPIGLKCGNADTYSVYVKSTATTTVYFAAGFYRLK